MMQAKFYCRKKNSGIHYKNHLLRAFKYTIRENLMRIRKNRVIRHFFFLYGIFNCGKLDI